MEGLRTSNQQFLVAFQQQVEKEVELLAGKVSQNTEEMKKKGAELVEVVSKLLKEVSRGTGEFGKQVINLEARETAVEVEASKAAEDAKESANQIFELSQTIASLDGRHIETVERMKEVAVMVNKEIGQAFKEDQRRGEETKTQLEHADRQRRGAEQEPYDVTEQLSDCTLQSQSLQTSRRKLDSEMQTLQADLEEMLSTSSVASRRTPSTMRRTAATWRCR